MHEGQSNPPVSGLDSPEQRLEHKRKYWESLRNAIVHEDNLVNHRLTWALTIEGFLVAGFFVIQKTVLSDNPDPTKIFVIEPLLAVIFSGALWLCLISGSMIAAAYRQIAFIRSAWLEKYPEECRPLQSLPRWFWKGGVLSGGYYLVEWNPCNEKTKEEIIQAFKKDLKSGMPKCAIMIVRAASHSAKWTLAGFNGARKLITVVIDDPSHSLWHELKKAPANESRIVKLALSILGRTLTDDAAVTQSWERAGFGVSGNRPPEFPPIVGEFQHAFMRSSQRIPFILFCLNLAVIAACVAIIMLSSKSSIAQHFC